MYSDFFPASKLKLFVSRIKTKSVFVVFHAEHHDVQIINEFKKFGNNCHKKYGSPGKIKSLWSHRM